ncbi:DUF3726 domain-containing protein [Yoonia sp. 2307UL14-13]|uniref:DUF3726 domain-containing protein n=1 Tax=Yoonia sp. 2307UL14-13 TaxID=3126506 RepID=UPI0030A95272
MKRSLNEIGALVYKAALGVGIPVGQAEDLSRTALYLASQDTSLSPILDALREPSEPIDVAMGGDQLVIKSGTAAMTAPMVQDCFCSGTCTARLAKASHSPLVAAMLAQGGMACRIDGAIVHRTGRVTTAARTGPVDVPDDVWLALSGLAARILVPDSAVSRAGAGPTGDG